jgi:hypothetical protein
VGHWLTIGQECVHDDAADKLIGSLFEAADAIGDSGLCLQAHHAAWVRTRWVGQPQAAHDHVTTGLARYDPSTQAGHAVLYGGHDAAVCGHGHHAIAMATDLCHAPSLSHALWLAGFVHQMRRDAPAALETADHLAVVAGQHDFAVHRAAAACCRVGPAAGPRRR